MAAPGNSRPDAPQNTGDEDYLTKKAPPGKYVTWFHREADTDASELAIHHTLGNSINQAAKGNHRHDGKNGLPLLSADNASITGTKYASGTPAASDLTNLQNQINSLTAALVALGAKDNRS